MWGYRTRLGGPSQTAAGVTGPMPAGPSSPRSNPGLGWRQRCPSGSLAGQRMASTSLSANCCCSFMCRLLAPAANDGSVFDVPQLVDRRTSPHLEVRLETVVIVCEPGSVLAPVPPLATHPAATIGGRLVRLPAF